MNGMGQPVVLVAALCNKCSAFVVKKDAGMLVTRQFMDQHPEKVLRLVKAHPRLRVCVYFRRP